MQTSLFVACSLRIQIFRAVSRVNIQSFLLILTKTELALKMREIHFFSFTGASPPNESYMLVILIMMPCFVWDVS